MAKKSKTTVITITDGDVVVTTKEESGPKSQGDFILLDRSGSMGGTLWVEALSSINTYVKKLADDKVDTKVTVAVFDTLDPFQIVRENVRPADFRPLTNDDASPRGGTPLNDATGKLVALAKRHNHDRAAIIIMTDGHENASRELSVAQAKALLDECRAKDWQVIFLGANFDNAQQATSYGTSSANFTSSSTENLTHAMAATASLRAGYATVGAAMNFTDEQKKEFAKGSHK